MGLDRRLFFQVTTDANSQFSHHLNTQIVRFCLFNTVVFSCFFFAWRCSVWSPQMIAIAGKRMPASVDSRRPKQLDSIEEPVFPFERIRYSHPLTGLLWETKARRSSSQTKLETRYQRGTVFYVHRKAQRFFVHVPGRQKRWLERETLLTFVENSAKRNQSGKAET